MDLLREMVLKLCIMSASAYVLDEIGQGDATICKMLELKIVLVSCVFVYYFS